MLLTRPQAEVMMNRSVTRVPRTIVRVTPRTTPFSRVPNMPPM